MVIHSFGRPSADVPILRNLHFPGFPLHGAKSFSSLELELDNSARGTRA